MVFVFFCEGIVEIGEMIFDINLFLSNFNYEVGCGIYFKKGCVFKMKFNVMCYGWDDEDLFLSY